MQNDGYIIEVFDLKTGDVNELLALVANEYGEVDPAHVDYFNWYCIDNPAGLAAVPIAREKKTNKIVAAFWLPPHWARINGKAFTGSSTVNIVVDPNHRRQGLAIAICDLAAEAMGTQHIDYLTNFPNPYSIGMVEQTFWRKIGPQDLLVRPLDWVFLNYSPLGKWPWLVKLAAPVAGFFNRFLFRPKSTDAFSHEFQISTVEAFDSAFNLFWDRVKDKYPIMYVHNAAFLDWRYTKNPRRTYTTIAAKRGAEILGYLVYRVAKVRGVVAGFVSELLVDDSELGAQAGELLLQHAEKELRAQNIDLMLAMMRPNFHEGTVMRRQGFIPFPQFVQPIKVVLFLGDVGPNLPTATLDVVDNWFLQLGDYDII